MKTRYIVSIVTSAAALFAVLSLAPVTADGQAPADATAKAGAKAKVKGGPFPQQLTLFDREGKAVRTLGEPGLYGPPVFSPDGTRLAVTRTDPTSGAVDRYAADIWVFDLSTGASMQVTFGALRVWGTAWSPDGSQIAYPSHRENYTGLYRKASDGTGSEELLYRHTLAAIVNLWDWSPDGRFLLFTSGGVLYVLPLTGERKAVELAREEYDISWPRLSPDSRFLAYRSDESGRNEVYVRAFDPSLGRFSPAGGKWRVSDQGALGAVHWRQDGKELYYLATPGVVMAAEVTTTPAFTAASPKLLFRGPAAGISRDGQRVAFAVPMPPPERKVVTVAPEILAKYAGTYVKPYAEQDWMVTLEGHQLMIQPTEGQGEKLPLFAESETYFFRRRPFGDNDIEFIKDDKGVVTHFIWSRDKYTRQ